MSDTTQTSDCAAIGATTEEHEMLEAFVGTFAAKVSMWMGPGDPMVSTGVMNNTMELGGRFLHQSYIGDATDGPFPEFEGRGYWGYNTTTKKWEGFWIDTATTAMQTEQGDVDASGTTWTMIGPEQVHPASGEMMRKKSIIRLRDRDHHAMEMSFITADGEQKVMEIHYTRQG